MFVWRRRAIRAAIERYPGLIGLLEPTIRAPALLAHAYEQLKPVSIDFALMESAARDGKVVMGSMDVGWSDIGSWTELLAAVAARWHRVGGPARRTDRRERRRPRRAACRRGDARHPAAPGR